MMGLSDLEALSLCGSGSRMLFEVWQLLACRFHIEYYFRITFTFSYRGLHIPTSITVRLWMCSRDRSLCHGS